MIGTDEDRPSISVEHFSMRDALIAGLRSANDRLEQIGRTLSRRGSERPPPSDDAPPAADRESSPPFSEPVLVPPPHH
jgi:hypothetical protein